MTQSNALWSVADQSAMPRWQAPLLHIALDGYVDAGGTQNQVVAHLLQTLESERVAHFDVDSLVDYRGRRPTMTFDRDHWADYNAPELVVDRLTDDEGRSFLLLHGVEPDYRWEAFTAAITELCDAFGVQQLTSVHGVPMAVPHTRPVGLTRHSNDPMALVDHEPLFGTLEVPASVSALLQLRLGEGGRQTFGLAVHVPHYLAQTPFADAALTALEAWCKHSGIEVPLAALRARAEANRAEIAKEVAQSGEAREIVEGLEASYDRFLEGQRKRSLLASAVEDLPSADEIGAVLEEFLKEQSSTEHTDSDGADGVGPGESRAD